MVNLARQTTPSGPAQVPVPPPAPAHQSTSLRSRPHHPDGVRTGTITPRAPARKRGIHPLMEHAGVPISIISKWAGHYDSAFTQKTYPHASDEDLQRDRAAPARIHKIVRAAGNYERSGSGPRLMVSPIPGGKALTCGFGGALGGIPTPSLLIRSYLYSVQRHPDQSATWEACWSLVRTRSPGAGSRSPGWLPSWLPGASSLSGMLADWFHLHESRPERLPGCP
jgi:hypothetical protein